MKLPLKALVPLFAVAALAAACNPFAHKAAPQYPKDPRFSEFVFDFNEEPKIQTRVDSLNRLFRVECGWRHLGLLR